MSGPGQTVPEAQPRPGNAPLLLRLAVVLFVLAYMTGALLLVFDGWLHGHAVLRRTLGVPDNAALPTSFEAAVYAMLGAVLGAGALALVSFHKYVAVRQSFQGAHAWGYFIAPWLAAVMGLMVYALLQTGLLVFTGAERGEGAAPDTANLGYLATGFLSGFGWYDVTERLRQLVSRFFRGSEGAGDPTRGITERILAGGAAPAAPPTPEEAGQGPAAPRP